MKAKLLIIGVLFLVTSLVNAGIISNSFVVDDIEYYVEANDTEYELGEDVEMLFRVTNLRAEDVTISCSRTPEFNFLIEQGKETVWAKVQSWYLFMSRVDIPAGEFTEQVYTWDMIDNNGNQFAPGTYNLVGVMYNEPWNDVNYGNPVPTEVSVGISVVPEPATFLLLSAGLLRICKNNS